MLRSQKVGMLVLAAVGAVGGAVQAGAAEPVGAPTCAACHPEAYEAWRQGPHASALDRLTPAQRQDPACLRCHSPAWEAGFEGVQCETCHGPGQYYYPEYVMRDAELSRLVGLQDPGPATCVTCHDVFAPSLVPFDYPEKREAIRHWDEPAGR